MSSYLLMVNFRRAKPSLVFAFVLLLLPAAAYGQSFTLTPSQLHPAAVDPGGSATATVELMPTMGFDSVVDLTCTVASNQGTTTPPVCKVSPTSVTPGTEGAQLSLTIATLASTPAGTYQITLTGTSGSIAVTATLFLNVTDLTEDYTISVLPTTAVPSPVTAGNTANTTVTVAPLGSYTGTVTLSCLSVTPVVTGAPVCSFNPASVTVTSGTPPTSLLTITTFGTTGVPTSTSENRSARRLFYALWLALPALAIIGIGATGNGRGKLMGILMLLAIASGLIFLPACSSSPKNTATNQITPTDTYTFTLSGADEHGAGPSTAIPATVTLQVTPET
ncbi:MAG TPA: hypothetical protein VFF64_28510 [Candidatus Eremiobacteraceae bacterium]|nr:hypothetical protein [Candidatus Eremiobacteraceae bacterium]